MAASLSRQGTSSRIIGGATPSSNPSSGTVPGSITPAPAITLSRKSTQNISNAASGSNPGTGSSVSKMHTMMEPSILRAVQLGKVLRRFGQGLQASSGTNSEHMLSQEATHIDDFISHDWGSGRWEKTLTLWFLYNGTPAMLVSFAAAVLVGILQCSSVGILPVPNRSPGGSNGVTLLHKSGLWCRLLCPVVFATTFIFWQDLRQRLGLRTRLVFVDKFCIDQQREDRKKAGIMALAGFLKRSNRFVICWTPRYFTRLWCTYEVASWLHLRRDMDSVMFLPLSKVRYFIAAIATCCLSVIQFGIAGNMYPEAFLKMAVVGSAIVAFPCMHVLRHTARELARLPAQIKEFSIAKAECTCCSRGHMHPVTGKLMSCDRRLVYRTLEHWFTTYTITPPAPSEVAAGGQEDREERPLSMSTAIARSSVSTATVATGLGWFDEAVHLEFGPAVLTSARVTSTPYRQALFVSSPFVWEMFDSLSGWEPHMGPSVLAMLMGRGCTIFAVLMPLHVKLVEHMVYIMNRIIGRPQNWILDVLATLLIVVLFQVSYISMLAPLLMLAASSLSFLYSVAWICFLVVVTLWFYRSSIRSTYRWINYGPLRPRRRRSRGRPRPEGEASEPASGPLAPGASIASLSSRDRGGSWSDAADDDVEPEGEGEVPNEAQPGPVPRAAAAGAVPQAPGAGQVTGYLGPKAGAALGAGAVGKGTPYFP